MTSQTNLKKILGYLNNLKNLDSYTEMLEIFDQLIDQRENEEDSFLLPEELNLQLTEIFLKDTNVSEYDDLIRENPKRVKDDHFEQTCFDILEYLETVELEEYEPLRKSCTTSLDNELLKKLIEKYL